MAEEEDQKSLFRRLTRLFRSGPVVKRRVKNWKAPSTSTALDLFKRSQSHVYSNAINAYGQYDRMARYADFSEMEYCLSADTLIAVPGGYETIENLSQKYGLDQEFIVYAYDHNLGRIVPALAKQARQTRVDHSFKVTFDSGKEIIGTGNHRLMLRDGTFKRIDQLVSGDSMMPFYRKDLFSESKDDNTDGYRWIYTADPSQGHNGWVSEHKLIAEWSAGREMTPSEVVHHKNFVKYDNRPKNLEIMERADHSRLHQIILNGIKWSDDNQVWITEFKKNHSAWTSENNPAERKDITFGRILEISEKVEFNLYRLCESLNTDPNVIKRRLKSNGFNNFEMFAKSYFPAWKNHGWDNKGEKNPGYDALLSYQDICNAFEPRMACSALSKKLKTSQSKITNRIKAEGFKSYDHFKDSFANHKVVSVDYHGVIPLYDLTVDGYKNFATDTVISHNTPEIASALDIYSHESTSQDDRGRVLHIYSDNDRIKELLEDLFYETLNIEFNLTPWVRNLSKYGDFFLFNDVSPEYGVLNVFPIPVNEIEREEGFDPEDPLAVRFRWATQGNVPLENWQVSHFRLLGNDAFLPYGSSLLEPARRIWRQLILVEDAMLVYRVVRSPERRVFSIDVGNVPPEEVANYMESAKSALKSSQVIDRNTGRVDLRYNPLSVDEDYFLPVRGSDSGTKIDTLAGGTNITAIEDVEYIQKKLFAALKIPRAYLGYDEMLSSKATLAQEDIRFSRTINSIQRVILSELNKLAIVHLFAHGFEDEDLLNFDLQLSNPSSVAQQQKLELYRTKFEIAATAPEGMLSRDYIRHNILGLTPKDVDEIEDQKTQERLRDMELEAVEIPGGEGGFEMPGEEIGEGLPAPEGESPGGEEDLFASQDKGSTSLLLSDDDEILLDLEETDNPVTPNPVVQRYHHNRKRKRHNGIGTTHMPDFKSMVDLEDDEDPFDSKFFKGDPFKNEGSKKPPSGLSDFYDSKIREHARMTAEISSTLKSLERMINIDRQPKSGMLNESDLQIYEHRDIDIVSSGSGEDPEE